MLKKTAIFFCLLCFIVVLMEENQGKIITLSRTPFFDNELEDLPRPERAALNGDHDKYFMIQEIGKPESRKYFKQKQFHVAGVQYRNMVKQEFGKDLLKFEFGKTKISNGKVVKNPRVAVLKKKKKRR